MIRSEAKTAIQHGFKTTGIIFPFTYGNCNMSKLNVSQARNSFLDHCESVNIDNFKNNKLIIESCNYWKLYTIHKILGTRRHNIRLNNKAKFLMLIESISCRCKAKNYYWVWMLM